MCGRRLRPPAPRLGGWARPAHDAQALARLTRVAPGAAGDLDLHLSLEAHLDEAIAGGTLTHGDLYPFNLLLTDDRVVFVDWPHAWSGPAHADLVTLLSSVVLSGIDPEPFAARHPLLTGVEPEAVDVLISAQAGFLLAAVCSPRRYRSQTSPPPSVSLAGSSSEWDGEMRHHVRALRRVVDFGVVLPNVAAGTGSWPGHREPASLHQAGRSTRYLLPMVFSVGIR